MSPAKLTRRYPKPACGEGLASLRTAQVNHRGEFLLLCQTDFHVGPRSQNIDHALVQIRGGQLDRMARQGPGIKTT